MMRLNPIRQLLAALAMAAFGFGGAQAATVLSSSITGGTEDPSNPAANATDVDYLTYFGIDVTTGSATASFVVDLGSVTTVTSVAMYGNYSYSALQSMFSDDVTVSAGDSATGPFTVIGTINVGNVRPTDPDPAIGGENPWTGGNGRLIPTTATGTQFLKIEGGTAYDNNIDLYALFINPKGVVHRWDPVYNGVAYQPFDFGGGPANSRAGVDLFDGLYNTRTFCGVAAKITLDLGVPTAVRGFRFLGSDNDAGNAPKTGNVIVSSTDSPTNMNTPVMAFSSSGIGGSQIAIPDVILPADQTKRYFQIELLTNQGNEVPSGAGPTFRIGEIDLLTTDNTPVRTPSIVPTSLTNTVEDGADVLAFAFDKDYLTRALFIQQTTASSEMSFVIDLGGVETVRNIAFYGDWTYRSQIAMLGNDIILEAGASATGPWTQIGSRNVGGTRPTDPSYLIGGENPFTGGNGRLVVTDPTDTRYVRVTGSFAFDNLVLIYEMIVNAPGSLHRIEDAAGAVDVNQTIYDAGGGQPLNSRVGPDVFDANTVSRQNPRVAAKYTLDLGVKKTISMVRILPMDNDVSVLPNNMTVRGSIVDDPLAMNTVLGSVTAAPIIGCQKLIPITDTGAYRYIQLDVPDTGIRIGEIVVDGVTYVAPPPGPNSATNWTLY